MAQSGNKDRLVSRERGELYGRGYYFGKSSGYPDTGYADLRDNWQAWLGLLSQIKPSPGVFIDLGSAYGYLVAAARQAGYQAFGFDISTYALNQEPDLASLMAHADIQRLPVPAGGADVVTIFDVLEHLEEPESCLREALRTLKPDGLLVGTTPDPIFFTRHEETHCFERPPSFWLSLLQELGMTFQFRFSVDPYNFQFAAARTGTETAERLIILQHDYFTTESDFITVEPAEMEGRLHAVPRFGWGPLEGGSRGLQQAPASIYLLNTNRTPVRLTLKLKISQSPDFSTLRVRLDSHVLEEIYLTSEQRSHSLEMRDLFLPAGGHHLFFDLFPGGPEVVISDIEFSVAPAASSDLTPQLPFDLQQRYRLAGEITQVLAPSKILDVGGYLGDQHGHLATSEDFLALANSTAIISTTDLRHCDHPSHHPCEALKQPFSAASFDLVLSLDVLEHIRVEQREDYLRELDRVASHWILLGAPFFSQDAATLEASLADQLDLSFLKEHHQHGLPEHALVEDFFVSRRGYSIKLFPNGYLPTWSVMQMLTQHLFSIRDHQAIQAFNRLYTKYLYPTDQRSPSYRTLYLISKHSFTSNQLSMLDKLIGESVSSKSGMDGLALDPALSSVLRRIQPILATQAKALNDVQFLINERQHAIQSLTALNEELQAMPLWKVVLKRARRRLRGRPAK